MSRFDVRDVSTRLAGSPSAEGLISELLASLQAADRHWHASFAGYEMSADALTSVYEREGLKLVRRELVAPVGELPQTLARKLFAGMAGRDPAGPSGRVGGRAGRRPVADGAHPVLGVVLVRAGGGAGTSGRHGSRGAG